MSPAAGHKKEIVIPESEHLDSQYFPELLEFLQYPPLPHPHPHPFPHHLLLDLPDNP